MSSSTAPSDLAARIAELGAQIKQLKASSSPFDAELKEMLSLKAAQHPGAASGSGSGGNSGKLQLKTPKGTKDHPPSSTLIREKIFSTLRGIFVKHGAMTIDTPVFELKEILSGKWVEPRTRSASHD